MRPSFFLYFPEIRNKRSNWSGAQSGPRLYDCYNLCPCPRPAARTVLALARVPVLQASESWMVVLRFTTLSARDRLRSALTKSKKKKIVESTAILKVRVSALTGSVPHKMAYSEARQNVSALIRSMMIRSWTQVAWLTATHLNNWTIGSYELKKKGTWLVVFRHLRTGHIGLLFLDCSSWLSRPDTKYENSWTQTFDPYLFLHSTYIGVENFSLHTIFAKMLIKQLINLEKVRTDNLKFMKFRTKLRYQVMDGWSVTQ